MYKCKDKKNINLKEAISLGNLITIDDEDR